MKIGVFGGTFDPPHHGHLQMAVGAREQLGLDEVLWIPSGRNPLKATRPFASGKHRLKMAELAIDGEPGMAVSDLEVNREGPSYTVDTLNELSVVMPGEYWLILGGDSLRTFERWKAPERILKLARLAVLARPPHSQQDLEAVIKPALLEHVTWLDLPPSPTSSTEARDLLAKGRGAELKVPGNVLKYIASHNLYRP